MKDNNFKSFASDNNSGIHPEILKAIIDANVGHTIAYGDDVFTKSAVEKFKEHFGDKIDVYFVFNGTGANVLSVKGIASSFNSVICAETSHLNIDECGAPENFTGCKLVTIPTSNGKINTSQIKKHLHGFGFEHHAQPKMISITQATELGTVYLMDEIKEIADLAHSYDMIVHMDGARLANAATFLNVSLKTITAEAGIDILSFGGTKNGMMFGEAVIFFNKEFSFNFKYVRKQGMQLASKMRFIAAQFEALLSNALWEKNASHSNTMARLLSEKIKDIPKIKITQKVETNAVFASLPMHFVPILQNESFFYAWNEETSEVRWMTSFDTTEDDVVKFTDLLRKIVK